MSNPSSPVVLASDADIPGSGGVVWSLPHSGDLDANLVRLGAGQRIDEHVNDEVDVLVVVRAGTGRLTIDDTRHELGTGSIALVPVRSRRSIVGGEGGVAYLSIHRRRGPLMPGERRPSPAT